MEVASPAAEPAHRPLRRQRAGKPAELAAKDLTLRSFWNGLKAESIGLILLCVYMTFEYVRPQQMYSFIDVLPWGLISIVLCTISAAVSQGRSHGLNFLDVLCGIFLIVLALSMVTAYDPAAAIASWLTVASTVMLFFCVRSILSTANRILIFTICFAIINLKFSQYSARAFLSGRYGSKGAGWFSNSGELAMQMGVAFFLSLCVLLALRPYVAQRWRWWLLMALFPGTALLAVLGSASRASQLGLAVAATLMLIKPPQLLRKIVSLSVLVALVAVLLPESQKERFRSAGEDDTSKSRLAYFEIGKTIVRDNPQGIGYANWRSYYSTYHWDTSVFSRIEVSHNSYIDAFAELGYHGGGLFVILLLASFGMNLKTQLRLKRREDVSSIVTRGVARGLNLGLLSTCIAAYFMSVLYYPVFWLGFAMTSAAYQVSRSLVQGQADFRVRKDGRSVAPRSALRAVSARPVQRFGPDPRIAS